MASKETAANHATDSVSITETSSLPADSHSTRSDPPPPASASSRTRQVNGSWRTRALPGQGEIEGDEESLGSGDPTNGQSGEQHRRSEGSTRGGSQPMSTRVPSLPLPYATVAAARDSSTPRSVQLLPLPSSSTDLTPATGPSNVDKSYTTLKPGSTATSAFEVDDLLGPRRHANQPSSSPAPSSGPSQPASTHSDDNDEESSEPRRASKPKLQGLGLATTSGGLEDEEEVEMGTQDESSRKPGTFRDGYFDDGEDTDESWLNYSSSSRRRGGSGGEQGGGGALGDGTSSTSHHHSSSNTSTSNSPPSHVSSPPNPALNSFGSPLSPHVPPFSPGSFEMGQQNGEHPSHPWTSSSAVIMGSSRIAGAREREASWASVTSDSRGPYSTSSHRSGFATTVGTTSDSHASSTRSYSPFATSPPSSHGHDFSSTSSPAFPHVASMQYAPPCSHLDSFETCHSSSAANFQQLGSKDVVPREQVAASRYVRAPYTMPPTSTVQTQVSTTTGASYVDNVTTPTSTTSTEEITTLFVFGFPEDMMEREFQNLFLFAPGFEAATLKVPHLGSFGGAGGGGGGGGGPGGEGGVDSNGTGHRASVDDFDPRNASAFSGIGAGAGSSTTTVKKQKIGFAKFATKQDAMDAMEVLNRRRIDHEKGLALRADMAKKNLHVRKSIVGIVGVPSSSQISSMVDQPSVASSVSSLSSGSNLPTTASTQSSDATSATPIPSAALHGTGPSIPLSALDSETLQKLANSTSNPAVLAEIARQSAASSGSTSTSTSAVPTSTATEMSAYEAFHSVPSVSALANRQAFSNEEPQHHSSVVGSDSHRFPSNISASLHRHPSLQGTRVGGHAQQHFDDGSFYPRSSSLSSDPFPNPSPGMSNELGFSNSVTASPRDRQIPFPQQSGQVSIAPSHGLPYGSSYSSQLVPAVVRPQTQAQQQASSQLAQQQAQIAAAQAYARSANPADMNAPKNTLYVGGLPAVLPSLTGPFSASHLEDSLRNAFSRCPGFKRLQFRSKSNGPIVFVEFEDTAYATRAMNEMYGYTLGGLVKGGIRLSYSKNPLGVRSNGLPSGNPPPLPGNLVATAQVDPSLHSVVYPAYAVSYATTSPALVESHRRHPDPFYGASAFTSPPSHNATPHLSNTVAPASFNSVDQHIHRAASSPAIGHSSQSTTPYGTTTPQTSFGSTFSPFSAEY